MKQTILILLVLVMAMTKTISIQSKIKKLDWTRKHTILQVITVSTVKIQIMIPKRTRTKNSCQSMAICTLQISQQVLIEKSSRALQKTTKTVSLNFILFWFLSLSFYRWLSFYSPFQFYIIYQKFGRTKLLTNFNSIRKTRLSQRPPNLVFLSLVRFSQPITTQNF